MSQSGTLLGTHQTSSVHDYGNGEIEEQMSGGSCGVVTGGNSSTGNGSNNAPKRAKIEHDTSNSQTSSTINNQGLGGGNKNKVNNTTPSRVIHLRNIPSDASEAEIIQFGIAFGQITNILVLKGKNQAFLEMADEASAISMVSYLSNCPHHLRDRPIYVQFSNHKELRTDHSHSNSSASTQAALQAANSLSTNTDSSIGDGGGGHNTSSSPNSNGASFGNEGVGGCKSSNSDSNTSSAANHLMDSSITSSNTLMGSTSNLSSSGSTSGGGGGGSILPAKTVLRVMVERMIYPVTLDVIHQIFSRIGQVQKIVTFTKNNTYQALVQYPDVVTSQAAKMSLDGRNIYNGCCTLKIDFSKLTNLNVKYNNDKSRDYTNPNLEAGPPQLSHTGVSIPHNHHNVLSQTSASDPGSAGVLGGPPSTQQMFGDGVGGGVNNLPTSGIGSGGIQVVGNQQPGGHASAAAQVHQSLLAAVAASAAQSINQKGQSISNLNPLSAINAALNGAVVNAATAAVMHQQNQSQQQHGQSGGGFITNNNNSSTSGMITNAPSNQTGSIGPVLLVSNLNETEVTCDNLFTLFGVYGNVIRVKILHNKKNVALIQMGDIQQALLAMAHLDRLKVFGKNIKVVMSIHQMVQMPKEGQQDNGLTKEYTNSQLNRFKKPGSKNHLNIFPPSSTLHLSNIPECISESELKEAFKSQCFNPPYVNNIHIHKFKFFPSSQNQNNSTSSNQSPADTSTTSGGNNGGHDANNTSTSSNNSSKQERRRMALIKLDSVEEAVLALIKMHNFQLTDSSHLRVSFSKSTV